MLPASVSGGATTTDARSRNCASALLAIVLTLFVGAIWGAPVVAQNPDQSGASLSVFGPKRYLRTTGRPNEYTDTFAVSSSARSPFVLHVTNGGTDGANRLSSATITL